MPWVTPELLSDLGQELLDLGTKIVGLKLGERGLYLRTASRAALEAMGRICPSDPAAWADREMWTPCFQVNVVGTTGAGDATIAGELHFSICTAEKCLVEKRRLAVTVKAD